MSWSAALEQADLMQIEGATPHRVRLWADEIRDSLAAGHTAHTPVRRPLGDRNS